MPLRKKPVKVWRTPVLTYTRAKHAYCADKWMFCAGALIPAFRLSLTEPLPRRIRFLAQKRRASGYIKIQITGHAASILEFVDTSHFTYYLTVQTRLSLIKMGLIPPSNNFRPTRSTTRTFYVKMEKVTNPKRHQK